MQILHILPGRQGSRAGVYASRLILGLHRAGIGQRVVMDSRTLCFMELMQAGIDIIAPRTPLRIFPRRLSRRVAGPKPDAIHCWTRSASRFVAKGKAPIVNWLAGPDEPRRFADGSHFTAANQDIAAWLVKNGVPAARTHVIPVFSAPSTVPPADRDILATPRDAKVLISLARLHPESRLDVLLAALRELPDCMAWLAGEGPHRRPLEKLAQELGVVDRVRFAGRHMDRGALLRAADLCVLTAPDRPFDAAAPQAWAAGAPLIAVRTEEHSPSDAAGAHSLLIPAGDEATLADAVRRILGENELRRRLVAQGYAAYLGAYTCEAVVRQWIELYRKMGARGWGLEVGQQDV